MSEISVLERVLYPRTTAVIAASGVTVLTVAQASADLLQSTASAPAVWVFPGGGPSAVAVYNAGSYGLTVETAVGSGTAASLAAGQAFIVEFDGGLVRARAVDLRALGLTLPLPLAQGGTGSASGTLSETEIVNLGAVPLAAGGTSTGGIYDAGMSGQAVFNAGNTPGLCDALHFHDATQDFTGYLPVVGPYDEWLVWNDTDYVATLKPASGGTSTVLAQTADDDTNGAVILPRTRAVVGLIVQAPASHDPAYGLYTLKIFGTTAWGMTGKSSITLANANLMLLTALQSDNAYLYFSGGNQNITVNFPSADSGSGRTWTLYNGSIYNITLGNGAGPVLYPNRFGLFTLDAGGTYRLIAPTSGGQTSIGMGGTTYSLTVSDAQSSNIEIVAAAGASVVTFPSTKLQPGQGWVVGNTSGFDTTLIISGDTNPVYLHNGDRKFVYYDGTSLRWAVSGIIEAQSGYGANANGSNLVVAGGQSTGFGTGGELHLQIGSTGSSGSALNALYDKLVLVDNLGSFLQMHAGTGDVLRIQTVEAATAGSTLKSLPGINFRGRYWNGSVSTDVDAVTDLNVSAAAKFQYRISTGGIPRLKVGENGQIILAGTHLPANTDLANSEVALWLDDSVGATKLMIIAKDSAGNVRTGSIPLA